MELCALCNTDQPVRVCASCTDLFERRLTGSLYDRISELIVKYQGEYAVPVSELQEAIEKGPTPDGES